MTRAVVRGGEEAIILTATGIQFASERLPAPNGFQLLTASAPDGFSS
jgi:hypothetical protein